MTTEGSPDALCTVPWPICPFCAYPLAESAGRSWCEHEGCLAATGRALVGTDWASSERTPCPDRASELVTDHTGAAAWMCRAHALAFHRAYRPIPPTEGVTTP